MVTTTPVGGAASDNTSILRCLIERKVESAALGPLWHPIAVRLCFQAGEGAKLPLRIGGKIGPDSSVPIDAAVSVTGLKRDCWQSSGPTRNPLGDCAAVRIGGVEVVLSSERTQALGLERGMAIELQFNSFTRGAESFVQCSSQGRSMS
ncbi:MlrC C-terminal domain-containing protein [Mesorhizobium sp. M0207]|uniref:MlrC C-terminal domain-containing protein n=1 Tax=Mesorhizobium sp. M0207 TaxID=2956915 RepID=UPI00333AB12E